MIYWKVIYGHRNGSEEDRGFFRVPGGYRNPRESYWAYWAIVEERRQATGGGMPPPLPQSELDKGRGVAPLFPSPSLPSPFPLRWKERGANPPRTGVLVRLPSPWRTPLGPATSSPLLYICGQGAPQRHNSCILAVCGAPLHSLPPRSCCRSA